MSKTVADNLCERLIEWDVSTIYGLPGDGINGILGSLRRHQEQPGSPMRCWVRPPCRMTPFCTGSIGLLGTKPSWDMMQGADTLLMVGSSFPYSEFLPKEGQVKAAEIEDAWREALSSDRPVIISALTDPNEALLPPHITFEQAEGFAKSILADPQGGIPGAVESVREKVHEFLPGR